MIINKVLNNNAVISMDSNGKELIVLGKGIAFKKSQNDVIDDSLITGIYELKKQQNDLVQLAQEIPYEYFEIAQNIASDARKALNCNLNDGLALQLADHIYFAHIKLNKGIRTPNLMLVEISQFYKKEYELGEKAVEMINQIFNSDFDANEAGFIAFHLVQNEDEMQQIGLNAMIEEMKKIVSIVEKYFNIEIDRNSYDYSRFVIHLRFFLTKVFTGLKGNSASLKDDFLYQMLTEKYADILDCLRRVNALLLLNHEYELTDSDKMYLIIHIARIIKK